MNKMFYTYEISVWRDDLSDKLLDVMKLYENNITIADAVVKRLGVLPERSCIIVSRSNEKGVIDGLRYDDLTKIGTELTESDIDRINNSRSDLPLRLTDVVLVSKKCFSPVLDFFDKTEEDIVAVQRDTVYPTKYEGVYVYIGNVDYTKLYMTIIEKNGNPKIVWAAMKCDRYGCNKSIEQLYLAGFTKGFLMTPSIPEIRKYFDNVEAAESYLRNSVRYIDNRYAYGFEKVLFKKYSTSRKMVHTKSAELTEDDLKREYFRSKETYAQFLRVTDSLRELPNKSDTWYRFYDSKGYYRILIDGSFQYFTLEVVYAKPIYSFNGRVLYYTVYSNIGRKEKEAGIFESSESCMKYISSKGNDVTWVDLENEVMYSVTDNISLVSLYDEDLEVTMTIEIKKKNKLYRRCASLIKVSMNLLPSDWGFHDIDDKDCTSNDCFEAFKTVVFSKMLRGCLKRNSKAYEIDVCERGTRKLVKHLWKRENISRGDSEIRHKLDKQEIQSNQVFRITTYDGKGEVVYQRFYDKYRTLIATQEF